MNLSHNSRVYLVASTHEPQKLIEQCARISYQSSNTENDPKVTADFIRGLICKGHESPLEHASATFFIEGVSRACSHQIVRHRLCVTGDTVLMSFVPKKNYPHKEWTVRELYDWQSDRIRKSRVGLISTRSVDESTGLIVRNGIRRIVKTGVSDTVRITTLSGRVVTLTPDHPVYTPSGYIDAGKLKPGDEIYSNGVDALSDRAWLYEMYITKNNTLRELADLLGVCVATVQKPLRRFGIRKPRWMQKNRKPGYGKKGATTEEGRKRLREMHLGSKNKMWVGDSVRPGGARRRGRLLLKSTGNTVCEGCGVDNKKLETHHIDKNIRNNERANLRHLCSVCHHCWHHPAGMAVFKDEVVSVSPSGMQEVFDIEMKAEPHNFVGNGIVLHNCSFSQRSQRYTSEDDFVTNIPDSVLYGDNGNFHEKWVKLMGSVNDLYKEFVSSGVPKEDARLILPEACQTSLYATANFREWRHFLELRLSKHAQWEIRAVAEEILDHLLRIAPDCFFDFVPVKKGLGHDNA